MAVHPDGAARAAANPVPSLQGLLLAQPDPRAPTSPKLFPSQDSAGTWPVLGIVWVREVPPARDKLAPRENDRRPTP